VTPSKDACTALALLAEIPCSARAAEGPALDGSLLDRSEAQLDLMRPQLFAQIRPPK